MRFFFSCPVFPELLESVHCSTREAQGRSSLGSVFQTCPGLLAPHIRLSYGGAGDCRWLTGTVSSNQTHSDQEWNLAKAKPKKQLRAGWFWSQLSLESWGFISADTVSLLTTLIFPGHSLLPWLPLFLSVEEEKELVFPDGDPLPLAGVGLRELTLLHCVLIIYGNSDRFGWGAKWSSSKNPLQGPSSMNSWRTKWITKARLWSLFLQENPGLAHCFLST